MARTFTRRSRGVTPFRLKALIGFVFLALAMVVGAQAATNLDGENTYTPTKFQRINPKTISKVAGWKPAWIASNRKATVIVQMAGEPVGKRVADARRQGKELTNAEKDAIRAELKGRQDAIKGRIQSAGGAITADYQDAYNGLGVKVALKDLNALAGLPGVEAIRMGRVYRPDNTAGAQFIGAPQAWQNTGKTGAGVKVAIIDTGVDYTHANFGGPGTRAAYENNNGTIIEPGTFPTAKVVGGRDFVGDDYDASSDDPAQTVPRPDPDPLDCNGHGSHVAGTAAGFGVNSNGTTYTGPYNGSTYSNSFRIGPGVAPQALILAYRVFGCAGSVSTDVLIDAIDQAVVDGADVINMSIGSPFGRTDEPDAVASDVAALAGVVVVASAGNSGPNAYITGSPAAGNRVISVAAIDASSPTFPGVAIELNTGKTIVAINANNGGPLAGPNTPIVVLRNADGTVSLGCDPAEYAGTAGKIVVTQRGTCARVARAVYGQKAGAVAVIMINNTDAYPPFEGKITSNPDTGEQYTVTIPFLGVRGVLGPAPTADGDDLILATTAVSMTATTVTNTGYGLRTSFSSGGPRNVDSFIKPDVSAPGQSVVSTGVGTGNEEATISGTSMASPMTAGVAALVTQAHMAWSTEDIKSAIMTTARNLGPTGASTPSPRTDGTGVVQANRAVDSFVVAITGDGRGTLSYGYEPIGTPAGYTETLSFTLKNNGTSAVTYNLAGSTPTAGLASIAVSPASVTVAPGASMPVTATLTISAAQAAALPQSTIFATGYGGVTLRGFVTATPTTSGAGIYSLRVPYLVAPRGLSNVTASPKTPYQKVQGSVYRSTVNLTNSGIHVTDADVYSWGIEDAQDTPIGERSADVRSVGLQELPGEALGGTASDRSLVFAVNVFGRWSNASTNEFDIAVDTKGNSDPEFFVVGVDIGAVTTGTFDGRFGSFTFDAKTGDLVNVFTADAPMNGSTMLLPALASDLGLTTGSTKMNYQVASFPIVPEGPGDITSVGSYRVFDPPVSSGDFIRLNPGETKPLTLQLDRGKFAGTTVLGWLVVALDDANGAAQAEQISALPLP